MLKRLFFLSLTLASSPILSACGSTSLPRPQGPIPKNQTVETKENDTAWTPVHSTKKMDPSLFENNDSGYCGYEFIRETDQKTINDISSRFAQNWQSRSPYKNTQEQDHYFYDGLRIDLWDGLYTELKLYFHFDFVVSGLKEVFTKIEIARELNVAEFFVSRPLAAGKEVGARLLVLSTPEGTTNCMAVGFRFDSRDKMDELHLSNFVSTSSFGNSVTTTSLSEFFKGASFGPRYEIKK